jgi:hypothetical protein
VFTNVNIFNGTDNRLYEDHQVLIEGNLIKAIFTQAKGGPMYEASVGGQKFKVEAK